MPSGDSCWTVIRRYRGIVEAAVVQPGPVVGPSNEELERLENRIVNRPEWQPLPGDIHPYHWEQKRVEYDNPMWPLPKDYEFLTEEGKKQARIQAVSDHSTPFRLVVAWDMFRRLYLMPTEPGFFYHDFKPSPPFHYEMIYDLGRYGRNLYAAPRGTAKSIVMGTEVAIFLALTRPYIRIMLGMATDRLVEGRFDLLIAQFTENPFIIADFGYQKPKKGDATWNHHYLKLKIGSAIFGISVMGKKRGARPDLFLLDDPEFDPTSDTSATLIREKFVMMLFKQVIPMLEDGSSMFWIGTMIGSRSLLYSACHGDDPRFDLWNRRVLSLERVDDTGGRKFLWETKYNRDFADTRRREVGESIYAQEYLNEPGSETDRVLRIDRVKNLYWTDGIIESNPLASVKPIKWTEEEVTTGKWTEREEPFGVFAQRLFRVIVTDLAHGLTQYNDYSCIACVGFSSMNCLWVLDMWMGRVKDPQLMELLYGMGIKWLPKVMGIESISEQKKLVDAAADFLKERAVRGSSQWVPRVIPVDYHDVKGPKSKADRIRSLEWRFPQGKIKYPGNMEGKWPWAALFAQTKDFTYDLGMLPFDDAIDTVAQAHYVVHGKGGNIQTVEEKRKTLAEMIRAGEMTVGGVPILSSVGSQGLTPEVVEALEDRAADKYVEWREKQARATQGKRGFYNGRERYRDR